jgi:hypothetical protein
MASSTLNFLALHFGLGRRAHFDHRHAAGELRQTFLELFLVVVGGGLVDLFLDLGDAAFDGLLVALAAHDRGVLFVHDHAGGATQHVHAGFLELEAFFLGDHLAARQGGDVFQHFFAAVAEAGGFHRGAAQAPLELVDHEGRQGFAFHVFRDQQGTAGPVGRSFPARGAGRSWPRLSCR